MLWLTSEPPPYQSSEGQHVDASDRYQYQRDPGCTPEELRQLPTVIERAAQARGCANQAEDHRREVDDLTQQTRAAEAVERANWIGEANYHLSRLQLILSALGAGGLLYSLYLTRRATAAAVKGEDVALAAVREAQEANKLAAKNAFIEHRPWLYIEISEPVGYFLPSEPGQDGKLPCVFNIPIVLKNAGMTPAIDIECFAVCGGMGIMEATLKRALALEMPHDNPLNLGAVPPTGQHKFNEMLNLRVWPPEGDKGNTMNPWVTVVLRYRSATMPKDLAALVTAQAFRLRSGRDDGGDPILLTHMWVKTAVIVANPSRSEIT